MHLVPQTRVDTASPSTIAITVERHPAQSPVSAAAAKSPRALCRLRGRRQRTALFLHGGVTAQLRLGERFREGTAGAHHFPGGRISGPNSGSAPGIC